MDPKLRPFTTQFAFKPHAPNTNVFETVHTPLRMGNSATIAYGGYALVTACKAACLTTPSTHHLYSMLGHFLGPTLTDRTVHASVRTLRQTRSFATRQVEVSQKQDDGEMRICLVAIADFQVCEPASLLTYSRHPSRRYSHWKDLSSQPDYFQKLAEHGEISFEMLKEHEELFGLVSPIIERRQCLEGIFAQNLFGIANPTPTTQDHLSITERTTADWFKCKQPLNDHVDHLSLLAFLIDDAIAFAPLSFSNMWYESISACSALDFALRVFQNGRMEGHDEGLDMSQWHFRETTTRVGSEGRTFGESWVWDEQGRAVACMTQQSILRPHSKSDTIKRKGKRMQE